MAFGGRPAGRLGRPTGLPGRFMLPPVRKLAVFARQLPLAEPLQLRLTFILFQRLTLTLTLPPDQFGRAQPQRPAVIATPAPKAMPVSSALPSP